MRFVEERLTMPGHAGAVAGFCCGADNPLDGFLKNNAMEYDSKHLGNTYLIFESESHILIGFYTLKANGIQVCVNGEYNSIPVIELSRIALQYDFQTQGIGKFIFNDVILPKVRMVASMVAVYGMIAFVDPGDEPAIRYYKSLGFVKAGDIVQKQIDETFNEECDLYFVSLFGTI